jgi:hypothetical protein
MSLASNTAAVALHQHIRGLFEAHPDWTGLVSGGWRGTYRTSEGDAQIRREWDLDAELGKQVRSAVRQAQYLDHPTRELQDVCLVAVKGDEGMQMWVYETHVGSALGEHTIAWELNEHDECVIGLPVTTRWPLTDQGLDSDEEIEWAAGVTSEWSVTFELPPVPEANRRLVELGLNEFLSAPELSEQQVRQLGRSIAAVPRRRRLP